MPTLAFIMLWCKYDPSIAMMSFTHIIDGALKVKCCDSMHTGNFARAFACV